jgi:uncharacterized protein YqgV (UPF0045/DUF77 family)
MSEGLSAAIAPSAQFLELRRFLKDLVDTIPTPEDAWSVAGSQRILGAVGHFFGKTKSVHGALITDSVKGAFDDTMVSLQEASEAGVTEIHTTITDDDRRDHAQMLGTLQKMVSLLDQAHAHMTERLPANGDDFQAWVDQMDQIMSDYTLLSEGLLEEDHHVPSHVIVENLAENLRDMQHQVESAQKRHKSDE